jgi:hypothetical protein
MVLFKVPELETMHSADQSMSNPLLTDALVSGCRTCGVEVTGNFCSSCGETTQLHLPSAGEFLHEFAGHFVALEGKLWKTLKLLVLRPGQLTVEFMSGRRVPFVAPLRLYLTLSLVFFALIKILSIEFPKIAIENTSIAATYSHPIASKLRPGRTDEVTAVVKLRDVPNAAESPKVDDFQIHDAIAMVGKVNAKWMSNLARFMNETDEKKAETLNHGFLAYLPYMLIGALPLFALYLKAIYFKSGRHYGEHLVFALHSNAFAFLMATLMILIPGSIGWVAMAPFVKDGLVHTSAWDFLQIVPFLYLVAYLPIAMRRVYGGTRAQTGWRWLVLVSAHLLVVAISTIVAELIGIMGSA